MKKKVGIITFHCSYNYGSALQAYATQTFLEKHGYDPYIIDYVFKENFSQYKLFRLKDYKNNMKYFFSDILYFLQNYKRRYNFHKFWKNHFKLTNKKYKSNNELRAIGTYFDAFICGSDQIWNLDCTNGINSSYFLSFADNSKLKIAYAPSLAHNDFKSDYKNDLKTALVNIDYISIREESTLPLIQSLVDKPVSVVLDPTLLLTESDYCGLFLENFKMDKEYIFVYMLENNLEFIEYCNEFSRIHNIQIFYISQKKISGIKGKNLYGVSPNTFLTYIKNAKYVFTNSFHATVFSLIFHKKFCTFPTLKSSSRMTDLLSKLGLSNRIFSSGFCVDDDIDYSICDVKLEKLRSKSKDFLLNALQDKNDQYE